MDTTAVPLIKDPNQKLSLCMGLSRESDIEFLPTRQALLDNTHPRLLTVSSQPTDSNLCQFVTVSAHHKRTTRA